MDSLRGQLLVAAPTLVDPNFRRSVVLIAEHDEDGALGVILNRPLEVEVADGAPELAPLVPTGTQIHAGGPVRPSTAVVVAEFEDPSEAGLLVLDSIGLPGGDVDIEGLAAATRRVRIFAGHSGWGPGQLDAELEREDWILAAADPADVFVDDSESLWTDVLERKGGSFALLARMPDDPRMN